MQAKGKLTGTVKHYDWGGSGFIPSLIEVVNNNDRPFAEYWLGVHPQADCRFEPEGDDALLLRELVQSNPEATLGHKVAATFGDIPYLLKVLDVKHMLSIQVHPSKAAAEADFEEETRAGVPLTDPKRNYKDRNHKPELMVAVGDFWLLHGFKPEKEMKEVLARVPELNFLGDVFATSGYEGLYKTVMEFPADRVKAILKPLLDRIIPEYEANRLDRSSEDFWAARAALSFSKDDRGIFSVYLFNLVNLHDGEAIFQDAGVPHAYLEGVNVEIMASSDNVLRGGLTTKHIDVKELLKHTKCGPTVPNRLAGEPEGKELVYRTPAPDFELSGFILAKGEEVTLDPATAEILLLISGEISLDADVVLRKGSPSGLILPGNSVLVRAEEDSRFYKATVPGAGK